MAVPSYGIAATDGIQIVNSDVVGDDAGGTLDSSNVVQLNYDDTVFVGQLGKQRLLTAIDLIRVRIATARVWPTTSAS